MIKFNHLNLSALKDLARELAIQAQKGDIYLLYGELGTGKTTFTQSFANALGAKTEEISSPTFNLVHVYEGLKFKIWHFDLYRLKTKEEFYELGFEDALSSGVSIIEWPDIVEDLMPKRATRIYLSLSRNAQDLRDVNINTLANINFRMCIK